MIICLSVLKQQLMRSSGKQVTGVHVHLAVEFSSAFVAFTKVFSCSSSLELTYLPRFLKFPFLCRISFNAIIVTYRVGKLKLLSLKFKNTE